MAGVFRLYGRWTLAEQGVALAQYNLGAMHGEGKGVPQDYKTAFKWYELAAEQEEVPSQANLGVMYYKGQGVSQDYVRAHMWWNIAPSQGNEIARNNRDNSEKMLSFPQIETARRLTREWVEKHQNKRVTAPLIPGTFPVDRFWGGSASYTLRARSPPQNLSTGKVPDYIYSHKTNHYRFRYCNCFRYLHGYRAGQSIDTHRIHMAIYR